MAFNNTGTVGVGSGTLAISSGGVNTGVFTNAPGTTISFPNNYALSSGSQLTGIISTGGTAYAEWKYRLLKCDTGWGNIGGQRCHHRHDELDERAVGGRGNIDNGDQWGVEHGRSGTLQLFGALTNAGTVNWTGTGNLEIYNGYSYTGGINNLAGAVFNAQNDQSITCACYGNEYFNNAGLFLKSPTTGTTTIGVAFNRYWNGGCGKRDVEFS